MYHPLVKRRLRRGIRNPRRPSSDSKVLEVDMFMDTDVPSISLEIGNHSITGIQLDGGATVSLMTEQTMEQLGLGNMDPTNIVLWLADQRRIKPLGVLQGIKTIVAGLEFQISYLVVHPHSYGASISILLVQARCVQRWHGGTIIIGPRSDRVKLRVVSKEFANEINKPAMSETTPGESSGEWSEEEGIVKKHPSFTMVIICSLMERESRWLKAETWISVSQI